MNFLHISSGLPAWPVALRLGLYRLWATIQSSRKYRVYAATLLVLFIMSLVVTVWQPFVKAKPFQLSSAASGLLSQTNQTFAAVMQHDASKQQYTYNANYTPPTSESSDSGVGRARIKAKFPADASQGITVSDPVNNLDFTVKPQFNLASARQDKNRIVYPMDGGALVYSAQAADVKEDIIINQYSKNVLNFDYSLALPDGTQAQLESNGSLGVYGTSLPISGAVSTGSVSDQKLLEKLRGASAKDKLLFELPAPVIKEAGKPVSQTRAHYELHGNNLRVVAENLKGANFPLSVDPSVYVNTAQRLMRGNNETNLDFDTTNELIQKGNLTGARFNSWTSGLSLPGNVWNAGTAVTSGYVYTVGGSSGSTALSTVYWAKLNNSTNSIDAPNPGAGACASWCTNGVYNLPVALSGLSLVAYNGYLYVFGGQDTSGTRFSTVYIAKLGVNGEPSLWHPTDPNQANWVYWYSATAMSSARSYLGAVAYNNRMYLLGGTTSGATGGVTTVEYANINPIGTLSTFTSTGMTALTSARFGMGVHVYNDRLYAVGGNSGGTLQNTVQYIKVNSDGTLASSWTTAVKTFASARMAWGGTMTTIWGGYMYLAGGCTAVNASGFCTTVASDIQIASINADGSVTDWNTVLGLTSARIGYGLVSWRDTIYGIGGCTAQNTSTGACTTTVAATNYGVINQDGDASTVSTSVASGTAPCASTTFTNCDLPPAGNATGQGGRMSGAAVVNNGYLYYMGGCTLVSNGNICYNGNVSKTSGTVSYSAIAPDGTLVRPATCSRTLVGSWCVDTTNTINGSTGDAGFGATVYNGTVYVIGGTTGTAWQSNVWRTTFNSDGSVNAWTSQTFAETGLGNARGYMNVFARANPSSAGTYPANLYVLGGCVGAGALANGLDCTTTQFSDVYKCNLKTDGSIETVAPNGCTSTGQLQIDSEPGTAGTQGLGLAAGTQYASYLYLIGGQSPNETLRGEVMYAKIDNSNNIVDATTGSSSGSWQTSANTISPTRSRNIAFGYNGYLYALGGYSTGGASLNDLLFAKVNVSDGSIGAFTTSQVTVSARWDLAGAVNDDFVYTLGGCSVGAPPASCTTLTGVVQNFQLYNNAAGSPAAYSASTNLFATDRIGAASAISNGYIYVAGGCTSATDCTTASTSVQYALINPDGSLGTWAATTGQLPAVRAWGKMEVAGGTLYYIGGQSSTATDARTEVYYGTPGTGDIASWGAASNGLPAARSHFGAAVWNNRLYVLGGVDASSAQQAVVYASPSQASGGDIASAWTSTGMTSFTVSRSGLTAIAYANNLYVLGGFDGTNYLTDVQYASIASNGTVGSWSNSTSLPQGIRDADGYAANGFMYLFGGRSAAATCTTNTYVSPISANTTIASGNNPTGIGNWYQTNVAYTGARYGATVSQQDGRAYVIGGGCGATLTYTGTNRVVSSEMQAQPQVAKYSRMIDTDTDVFPTKWLMNGLDNSIGARWKLRYRSSTNATAAWGQETNYGTVSLGTPDVYTAIDSSGTNTNFARYYYLSVSIDSSQAFGYPEDVSRGPTIKDISLFFTSDPSKRLRHGATFTGGELQPLDTPF